MTTTITLTASEMHLVLHALNGYGSIVARNRSEEAARPYDELFGKFEDAEEFRVENMEWLHSLIQELEAAKVELPMGDYDMVYRIIEDARFMDASA